MKFGFDYHGVLDAHPALYGCLTTALVGAGHEVHIITGHQKTTELTDQLTYPRGCIGVKWTHWFSIVDYHIEQAKYKVSFEDDQPWLNDEAWNRTKAEYCDRVGIDLMIDDSPTYGSYFTGETVFLLQKNPKNQEAWLRLAGRI